MASKMEEFRLARDPSDENGHPQGIGVRPTRAVAQIMLAKVIRLIYKYGKDNK